MNSLLTSYCSGLPMLALRRRLARHTNCPPCSRHLKINMVHQSFYFARIVMLCIRSTMHLMHRGRSSMAPHSSRRRALDRARIVPVLFRTHQSRRRWKARALTLHLDCSRPDSLSRPEELSEISFDASEGIMREYGTIS